MSEVWTQTYITVTKKDWQTDVEVREIQPEIIISASSPVTISKEDFIHEIFPKHAIDPKILKVKNIKDAQNQTFLQGVPVVIIPIQQKDEVSQTTYMRGYPPKEYLTIMTSMNAKPPVFKTNALSQTEVVIPPKISLDETKKYLLDYTSKKIDIEDDYKEDSKVIVEEILNFLLSCSLWISDPDLYQITIETTSQEAQTFLRYNYVTNSIVMDNETQTKLTCEPKHSNSKLLTEYEETKRFVQSYLEECLEEIDSRIIIDEILDEIIIKGADRLKYPGCDQEIQTVATYKSHEKEKDLLRKLRMPVVIDPLEASAVVVPLMDDLLGLICEQVSRDARCVVKVILHSIIQQAVLIGFKFIEMQKQPKPIEEIFDKRKKKIESLKKEMKTTATQTGLAGVPVIGKLKEDILCSVCARQSLCEWCRAAQKQDFKPFESPKLLRTEDILLAYKPCYVMATVLEEEKNLHLQSTALMKKKPEKLISSQVSASQCITSEKIGDVKTINVLMTPKKNLQDRDSISGWTRIIDDTLAKSWSCKDTAVSSETNVNATSSTATISESCCKKASQSESVPSLQVTEALQILKNTFCTRDCTCAAKILKRNRLPDKNKTKESSFSHNLDNCTLLNLDESLNQSINNMDDQIYAKSRADKFKELPLF